MEIEYSDNIKKGGRRYMAVMRLMSFAHSEEAKETKMVKTNPAILTSLIWLLGQVIGEEVWEGKRVKFSEGIWTAIRHIVFCDERWTSVYRANALPKEVDSVIKHIENVFSESFRSVTWQIQDTLGFFPQKLRSKWVFDRDDYALNAYAHVDEWVESRVRHIRNNLLSAYRSGEWNGNLDTAKHIFQPELLEGCYSREDMR